MEITYGGIIIFSVGSLATIFFGALYLKFKHTWGRK